MGVWVVFQSRRSREKPRPVKAELRASQSSLFSLLVMRQLVDLLSSFFRVSLSKVGSRESAQGRGSFEESFRLWRRQAKRTLTAAFWDDTSSLAKCQGLTSAALVPSSRPWPLMFKSRQPGLPRPLGASLRARQEVLFQLRHIRLLLGASSDMALEGG